MTEGWTSRGRLGAELLQHCVDDDPPDPRLERAIAAEAAPFPDRSRESVLDGVVRALLVPCDRGRDAEKGTEAVAIQRLQLAEPRVGRSAHGRGAPPELCHEYCGKGREIPVRIHVSHADAVDDLREYLQRCDCVVELRGRTDLEADPPDRDVEPQYLRMELDAYLRVWRTMHPGATAEIADSVKDSLFDL